MFLFIYLFFYCSLCLFVAFIIRSSPSSIYNIRTSSDGNGNYTDLFTRCRFSYQQTMTWFFVHSLTFFKVTQFFFHLIDCVQICIDLLVALKYRSHIQESLSKSNAIQMHLSRFFNRNTGVHFAKRNFICKRKCSLSQYYVIFFNVLNWTNFPIGYWLPSLTETVKIWQLKLKLVTLFWMQLSTMMWT